MRVVTTLPAATELVAALGIDPVGVSHECDYPPPVRDRPAVTRTRIDADGTSGEIDGQVAEAGERVNAVDTATVDRLDPEFIVTQGVCDVCAVDSSIVEDALADAEADPEIVTIDAHTIGEVFDDLKRLGRIFGREERARSVRADLEKRLAAVQERTPDDPAARPRVAIFDWTDPVMVAAHWVPELVEIAGGRYDLASIGETARPRTWAELREYDPAVLVVAPCGFDLAQTATTLEDLTERDGWADITAVRTGRAWAMDGNHYLNRPGPRLVDATEVLARILHPDAFEDGPSGEAAVPLPALESAVV